MAFRENPDVEVLLHDLVPAGLQLVPEECIGAPDTVPAGQGEEGGVAVRGEAQSGVIPLLPREGGESAEVFNFFNLFLFFVQGDHIDLKVI
jgi:hypothetical protein